MVKLSELVEAIDFVSGGELLDAAAYVDRESGRIYLRTCEADLEEEMPDDLEDSDRYVELPTKRDLDLGRNLALSFAEEELSGDFETVEAYFRAKGAYARYKDLLERRSLLPRWYEFEARETERALRDWCHENDIAVENDGRAA